MAPLHIALDQLPASSRIIVGLSGGLDSCVLLHLLSSIDSLKSRLLAVHVNHGLSPHADAWAQHCQQFAARLGIACAVEVVQVDRAVASLELAARNARYQAFAKHLVEDDVLVTAHHQNDQAETFMLRLMRGSGLDGLCAMKAWSRYAHYWLWRPLLVFPRSDLETYALHHGLQWVEDESNQSLQFDRNFVRLELMPLLQTRWPHALNAMARASANLQDSQQLLAEFISQDLQRFAPGERLQWTAITGFSEARINAILRAWLQANAIQAPSVAQLHAITQMMFSPKLDATPIFEFPNVSIRRYRDYLYLVPALVEKRAADSADAKNLRFNDALPWGELQVQSVCSGVRLAAEKVALDQLSLRFRSGTVRIHLAGRAHSSDLKKLLQAAGCPPWLRPYLPLLYLGNELVCVPGIGVADGWQAEGAAPGWQIHWNQFGQTSHETCAET